MIFVMFGAGLLVYVLLRVLLTGFYVVRPDERAVITSFGKAQRLGDKPIYDDQLTDEERARYVYPNVRVVQPGGPYLKLPWQKVHKVTVSTQSKGLTWDPTKMQKSIMAVTKDNLTTGINGQIRFRVSEQNLYAYLFGVRSPLEHVMGCFISVLRERVANFEDPKGSSLLADVDAESEDNKSSVEISEGVSINDLRKNLPLLNNFMEEQCANTIGRYGVELDAALITEIDPPPDVDRALSAINSTRNQVAADISTARADSDQQITMSKRAVEIALNNAEAEVAPLSELSTALGAIKKEGGSSALQVYLRNLRIPLLSKANRVVYKTNSSKKGE